VGKTWLTTIAAALCAMGLVGPSADGSPADMAIFSHRQPNVATPAPAPAPTPAPASWQAGAPRPSSLISPWKNPIKYFAASVSEMPIGWKKSDSSYATTNPVMQAAQPRTDSISLGTPVGPPTPELFISTAQLCERQGDVAQARQHFRQALSMWPGHVDVLRAAARMEDRQGDLRLAESLYRQAVTSNAQDTGALNDLGLCLARQGRLDESLQVIEQAIQLQPDKPLYRNNAATVLVEMRKDQKALAHLAAVHGAADANYNLGQLLVSRGRGADATLYFVASLEQNPGLEAAQIALAKLHGAGVVATPHTSSMPAAVAQPTVESTTPVTAPQQGWPVGPQMGYPTTARSPDAGASSAMPPRYLPPVARRPVPAQR